MKSFRQFVTEGPVAMSGDYGHRVTHDDYTRWVMAVRRNHNGSKIITRGSSVTATHPDGDRVGSFDHDSKQGWVKS